MDVPLHPALVHLPIGLSLLLPFLALAGTIAVARGAPRRPVWGGVVVLAVVLAVSAWVALKAGENEEDVVERVVPHEALEAHEEAGERVAWASIAVLAFAVIGLGAGRAGAGGRGLAVLVAAVVTVLALLAGKLGGELVYRHGAAAAYTGAVPALPDGGGGHVEEDDD